MQARSAVPAGTNLFDSMVAFENYPYDERAGGPAGPRIREVRTRDATNFPLALRVHLLDRLEADLAYDPELFDRASARGVADRLRMGLTAIAQDPDPPLSRLPWTTAAARHRVR